MSRVSETQTCSFRRVFLEALQGMLRGPSPPGHALTWAQRVAHCWEGGPRTPGAAPGDSLSRCPCSGGPLGQVLSRGRIPSPGGIVVFICVALGECGGELSLVPSQRSLLLLQTPLPESPGATGTPTPVDPTPAPDHPHPLHPRYQCRSIPHLPRGRSCAVPMPQQGSRSARPRSPCNPCHPARWAQSLGHSGFCPRVAGPVHSLAPSRLQCHPADPSCHRTLSPSVQHATPPTGQHTGWVHRPDELETGL